MEPTTLMAVYGLAMGGAFLFSFLVFVPLSRRVALSLGVVDNPGGRKEHKNVTPLLGGLGVFTACAASFAAVLVFLKGSRVEGMDEGSLDFTGLTPLFLGSVVVFLTGIVDDVIKRKRGLAYYYKLMGQAAAILLAMLVVAGPHGERILAGRGGARDFLYLFVFLLWLLTTINSFNYSDNINGLMSGIAVIALLASIVYLTEMDTKCIVLGFILAGAMLGFIPYNFPRARVFIGDAGSMFVGYWVGILSWPMTSGFLGHGERLFGLDRLIAPFLILGVPLFDACFVLVVRVLEGRPIYLGDNQHLSHRLVRSGFSVAEAALLLWGAALIMAGIGAMAIRSRYWLRVGAFLFALSFMTAITLLVLRWEKRALSRSGKGG